MGIPAYFSHIVKNHPTIIKKLQTINGTVENLLLDCNSIIYDALFNIEFTTKTEYESAIIEYVCEKIRQYIVSTCNILDISHVTGQFLDTGIPVMIFTIQKLTTDNINNVAY